MLEVILYISYGVLLLVAGLMVRRLYFAAKHFTPPVYTSKLNGEIDIPSVTVCIPARNEMNALSECLASVIASDYDRLEVVVLDDVAGDDTSSIVRAFATDGVRFVRGGKLPKGWVGKNYALQGLLEEASGSYILFMDVDTRLAPNAVSNMVRYALSERASMVSVLPRREDGWRANIIFSPLRYFWEIIFHRKASPATASNAWLIRRRVLLDNFNGFRDLKRAIQPESQLSSQLAVTNEYRFLMGTAQFGVAYVKTWLPQLNTSLRLLFPLLGGQVSLAVIAILDLLLLLVPAAVVAISFIVGGSWVYAMGALIAFLYAGMYGWYASRVWSRGALVGAVVWPLLLVQEIILVITSTVQYKRGVVQWKGRTITVDSTELVVRS